MLQQMISNDAMIFFLGCCNRRFCDIAVVVLEMLQYIFLNVAASFFLCCSICSFDVAVDFFVVAVDFF
jgi:hypothetical protein